MQKKKEIQVRANGYRVQSSKDSIEKEPTAEKCVQVLEENCRGKETWTKSRANCTGGITSIKRMEARARGMFRRHREGSTALTETVANKYYPNAGEDCTVLHTSKEREDGRCCVRAAPKYRLR